MWRFEFSPLDFTQVNLSVNRKMTKLAIDLLDLQPGERVLDLFCGLGNFSLPLARQVGDTALWLGWKVAVRWHSAPNECHRQRLAPYWLFAQDLSKIFRVSLGLGKSMHCWLTHLLRRLRRMQYRINPMPNASSMCRAIRLPLPVIPPVLLEKRLQTHPCWRDGYVLSQGMWKALQGLRNAKIWLYSYNLNSITLTCRRTIWYCSHGCFAPEMTTCGMMAAGTFLPVFIL